jgi:hypothetical protein
VELVVLAMSSSNTLIVLAVRSDEGLKWALRVLRTKSSKSLWLVVDEKTMRRLSRMSTVKTLGERVLVFSGRRVEEFSLRVVVLAKPDEVYLCDESGSLEPVIRLIRLLNVSIREC